MGLIHYSTEEIPKRKYGQLAAPSTAPCAQSWICLYRPYRRAATLCSAPGNLLRWRPFFQVSLFCSRTGDDLHSLCKHRQALRRLQGRQQGVCNMSYSRNRSVIKVY
jgi:hypothetical protein